MGKLAVLLTLLGASTLVVAAPTAEKRQTTDKPYQLRTDQDPVYHYYLQTDPSNSSVPVLGPEASGEYYTISGSIQSTNTSMYLNIGTASTSYLPLYLSATADTTGWALEGDTIITSQSSQWGRQLNFLVCSGTDDYWNIYLQTGADQPSDGTCTDWLSLHLPCLC